MDIEEIVALSVKHNAGDLHLCSHTPPFWRRNGRLECIADRPVIPTDWLEKVAHRWLTPEPPQELC